MDTAPMTNKQLWTRWTLANAVSEMLGLGLTFLITGAVVGGIHGLFLVRLKER